MSSTLARTFLYKRFFVFRGLSSTFCYHSSLTAEDPSDKQRDPLGCSHLDATIASLKAVVCPQDEAQVPALNSGQTSYHQRDAGERLRGRGHVLSLTHPGGVRRLHQRALPAGSLPAPRAPERSPPLDRTPRPKSHSYHFIFILKFFKDLCSLDTSRPVRCVLYIN